jgi:uncharacterized low-complexity protein
MKSILIAVLALGFAGVAHAESETAAKAETTKNDVKRDVKKGWHRTQEAVCAEGDAKCAAKKAKHRVHEGSDYVKDKAHESVDKAD